MAEKFFEHAPSLDNTTLRVLEDLKRQNKNLTDVAKFAKLEGIPIWSRSMLNTKNNLTARSTASDNDSTVLLPLVIDSTAKVNGFLACSLHEDSITYKLYRGNEYKNNGYTTTAAPNANNIIATMLQMEVDVFGSHKKFKLLDSNLRFYHKPPNGLSYYTKINASPVSNNSNLGLTSVTDCIQITTIPHYCGVDHPPVTHTECVTTYYSELGGGGSGSGGFYGPGWTGGTGTGGTGSYPSPTGYGIGSVGGPAGYMSTADIAITWLTLPNKASLFLSFHENILNQIYFFLDGNPNFAVDVVTANDHALRYYNDPTYRTFIDNHDATNDGGYVWWKDALFLQPYGGLSFGQWAINYLNANPNVTFDVFENQFLGKSEGLDGSYDASYWENPSLSFPPDNLPSWIFLYATYPKHEDPQVNTPLKLYTIMGGNVLATYNSNPAAYRNTCALRISRALNLSLRTIPPGPDRYLDKNGHYNFLSARALLAYMKKKYGTPTGSNLLTGAQGGLNGENFPRLLAGKKGIYIMIPNYPGGCPIPPSTISTGFCASGHADIIDNSKCDGSCYFGATGGVDKIYIWELH